MRRKIVIAGASPVGAETAERVLRHGASEVLLIDSDESTAESAAGDLAAAEGDPRVRAAGSWEAAAGAGLAVIAGGDPEAAARGVAEHCPGAVVVVALDDVEAACARVLAASGFPRGRVLGIGGAVEALRLRAGLARALDVAARDVGALVLGGRGERAVPVLSAFRVAGLAVTDKLAAERVAALVAALRSGPPAGARTVAAATAAVVDAVSADRRALTPVALLCEGELGVRDAVAGVPAVLGEGGVLQVVEAPLDEDERAALVASAAPRVAV